MSKPKYVQVLNLMEDVLSEDEMGKVKEFIEDDEMDKLRSFLEEREEKLEEEEGVVPGYLYYLVEWKKEGLKEVL